MFAEILDKLGPEARQLVISPKIALIDIAGALFKSSSAQKNDDATASDFKILIDKDGNPTLNFHNKEVQAEFKKHLEALSKVVDEK